MNDINLKPDKISIDNIEFSTQIQVREFEKKVIPYLQAFMLEPNFKTFPEQFGFKDYQHMWQWETEKTSVTLFYRLNNGQKESMDKFKIKYNPNKINQEDKFLKTMLNIFQYSVYNPKITWVDVAFDYTGITTSDIKYDKGRKGLWSEHCFGNMSDKTIYMGKSGKNGSVKIYDKAFEETKGKADYIKTRFEVTIRDNIPLEELNQWKCKVDLPKLHISQIKGLYDNDELTPTEKLLIYSIEQGYPMEKLTYRQRKRYSDILDRENELYTKITPSQQDIEKATKDYIKQIFQ